MDGKTARMVDGEIVTGENVEYYIYKLSTSSIYFVNRVKCVSMHSF